MNNANRETVEDITYDLEKNRLARNATRIEAERLELESAYLKQKLERVARKKKTNKYDVMGKRIQFGDHVKFAIRGIFDPERRERNMVVGVVHKEHRVYIEVVYKSEEGEIVLIKRAPHNLMVVG